jgi:hypothetical protein
VRRGAVDCAGRGGGRAAGAAGRDTEAAERRERFLAEFVRPAGLERPATPVVADVIESVAALGPAKRARMQLRYWPLRGPLALYVRIKPLARRVSYKARLILDQRRGSAEAP